MDGAPNQGWAILPTGADAFDFVSSENASTDQRPSLEVTYALYPRWAPTASTSWSNAANWKYAQPNAPAAVARFGPVDAPATVTLDGNQTVGTLLIEGPQPYTFSPGVGGNLILANRGNIASIQVKQGQHTIAAPVQISDPTVFAIAPGAGLALAAGLRLNSSLSLESGELAVDQITGQGPLALQSGTTLRLTGDATNPSRITSLNLAGQAGAWLSRVDLGRSTLIIDYAGGGESLLPQVVDQIRQSKGANWVGNGIGSSAAAGDSATAIGYLDDPDSSSLIIRVALLGDANLDDVVDFADLVAVAQHYNLTDGSGVWAMGDFDYDGQVGFADLTLLAQNYNSVAPGAVAGASAAFDADLAGAFAPIPDPSAGSLLLVGASLIRRRRRRTIS
jgi:hypothetical protein